MTHKHTQGEWIAKDGQIYPAETGKTIALISYFDNDSEEDIANQKLIAAAPKMLEALHEAYEKLSNQSSFNGEVLDIIEDAINTATN